MTDNTETALRHALQHKNNSPGYAVYEVKRVTRITKDIKQPARTQTRRGLSGSSALKIIS